MRTVAPRLLLLAVLLPAAAAAQEAVDPDSDQALLQQAQPALQPVLQDALDHAPPYQSVPWHDDASGLSGDVTAGPSSFGGRLCRAVRLTVRNGGRQVAVEGQRCRAPGGGWGPGRIADTRSNAPLASPLIRDLQAALRRLDYYQGEVSGIAGPGLTRALLAFEHDEQVPPEAEPTPGLLELADAAIGRIPAAGSCGDQTVPDGASVACGSIR